MFTRLFLTIIVMIGIFLGSVPAASFGRFKGKVTTEWLDDGRKMRLLATFIYIDPKEIEWEAPIGWIIDGASIPKFAWSIIGGPFEGKYREASVIHDVACDQKLHAWEAVHEAFYYAMLCSGVESVKARIMYAAVYFFGPRWDYKIEIKTVAKSNVENAVNKIRLESAIGSKVDIVNIQPIPLVFPNQSEKVNITIIVTPPNRQLTETDFAKLKESIEEREISKEGAMSLEEIRNYHPIKK